MIDEMIKKHNLEEQELVKNCDALSDSEKTKLVHMLDRALESTNGFLTDEKVRFIAETTERLAEVISGLFRKSASEDKMADERFNKLETSLRDLDNRMKKMSEDAVKSDENIMKALDTNLKEIKELQLHIAKQDGREEAKTQIPDESVKMPNPFMKWIADNQFFVFIIIVVIAVQGGNIGNFISDLLSKLF